MLIGWAAWYTKERFYSSRRLEDFDALPDEGVLYVKIFTDRTTLPEGQGVRYSFGLSGNRWYFRLGNIIGDDPSLTRKEVLTRYPGAVLKRGNWTDDDDLQRVQVEAAAMKDLP